MGLVGVFPGGREPGWGTGCKRRRGDTVGALRGGGVGLRPHTHTHTYTLTHRCKGGSDKETDAPGPAECQKRALGGDLTAGISQPPLAPRRRLQGASLNFRRACDVSTRRGPLGRLPAEMWAGGLTSSR